MSYYEPTSVLQKFLNEHGLKPGETIIVKIEPPCPGSSIMTILYYAEKKIVQ
jgi:hypothetical protein